MIDSRITCRVRTGSGKEKTVTFRSTEAEIEKHLKNLFHASEYILYQMDDIKFSRRQEWKKLK